MDISYGITFHLHRMYEMEQKYVFAITPPYFERSHKTWGSLRYLLLKVWIVRFAKLAEDVCPKTHNKNILQKLCYHYCVQGRYAYFRPSHMPISRSPSYTNVSNSSPVEWIIKCSSISFQNVFSYLQCYRFSLVSAYLQSAASYNEGMPNLWN